jgi:hypothetical protein
VKIWIQIHYSPTFYEYWALVCNDIYTIGMNLLPEYVVKLQLYNLVHVIYFNIINISINKQKKIMFWSSFTDRIMRDILSLKTN